ncbi:MAG TPA: PqqD family peptide modification chaperone [Candidatus Methylomirabilis sp.]|nr:PqqD family peptide modification chaperone [Candidatus Methylomirabilis sp.]
MESLFSESWYRVADLKPRVRSHARIQRHRYRGETWYTLQDMASGRVHRFSPSGYLLIGLMDGRRTVEEIWRAALARLGDDAPTQDETIQLLGQLHSADILQCDVSPDILEVYQRRERQQRSKVLAQLASPLWWQIPLVDPEWLLARLLPWVRPLLGVTGAVLWTTVVGTAVVLAATHWGDLSADFLDRVLVLHSLVTIWLLFPILKTFHEMGHALTTKAFGGEVHGMGIMLLVFSPLPYVDVSSASSFPSKWQRIVVGAAGMLVELFLASLALFVWLAAEPGVVRTVAYDTMLIAGISTVVFNINPLLRYDGYYILSDFLEIPNLYTRSCTYVTYLCQRYLFGHRETEVPLASRSERAWFVVYAVSSFVYRLLVIALVSLVLLSKFFYLGVLGVIALLIGWLGLPLWRGLRFLATSPHLRGVRFRAIAVSLAMAGLIVIGLGVVRVPSRTTTEGVVWVPEEALVRAGVDGFVDRIVAPPGSQVGPGDVLVTCRDPELEARAQVVAGQLKELQARYDEQYPTDHVKAAQIQDQIRYAEEDLARTRKQISELTIRSHTEGTFIVPEVQDLPGRFVKRGDLLGYTVHLDRITVRAVVSQADIDLVQHATRAVTVRLSERLGQQQPAVIRREVPGAIERLPSAALGYNGGGSVAVDPRDTKGVTAMDKVFQIDLELPSHLPLLNLGSRVYVRFDHGREPLAVQWVRELRQLFLARLNV